MKNRHKLAATCLAAFSLSVALFSTACATPKYPEDPYAEVTTNKGMFVFRIGYGTSGFYAKETPGEKRFVISPNTVLIYEIEILS